MPSKSPPGRVPLYRQVQDVLLQRLDGGTLRPGDRLPPETDLAAELRVNRLTVRQAIGELTRAGRLVAKQGSGTFVAPPPRHFPIELAASYINDADGLSEAFRSVGRTLTESLVSSEIVLGGSAAQAEEYLPGCRLRRIDTVLAVDGEPWFANSVWMDNRRFADIDRHLRDGVPLYTVWRDVYGVRLKASWRSFAAGAASPRVAALLGVPPGAAVLFRDGLNLDADETPTVYIHRACRSDRVRFVANYAAKD
ncbi:GntR family transcriptional regulator [Rhodococcus sp. NCIMB 12038]|uniref:GntR family transcriptional regulator n=1 Tax=Rhodococcus sp. NCIMB 12038 TaxID=933800 RepID=UPI000B3C99FA|nr:GntR family transcriptional regulator [Rhodococcus sp. NCIMB 12038]OUS95299.1 GntR family transcriptional regulator [Rhodococcus sp. NCIMB 12038]